MGPQIWERPGRNGHGRNQERKFADSRFARDTSLRMIRRCPELNLHLAWLVSAIRALVCPRTREDAVRHVDVARFEHDAPVGAVMPCADRHRGDARLAPMCRRRLYDGGTDQTPDLLRAIFAAIVALYANVYGHDRTTVTTCISDTVVFCVPENILSDHEDLLIVEGSSSEVIDGRVAFQTDSEDEFTAVPECLTYRRVVAFVSANQTSPGVACERFFLDDAPLTSPAG